MLIKLDQVGDEPFRWEESPSISAESLGRSELLGVGGVSWSGQVTRDLAGYRLQARLSYRQTLTCTRCLAPVERPVDEEIELTIELRDPENNYKFASGRSYRTSLARRSPEEMVAEVLGEMFGVPVEGIEN